MKLSIEVVADTRGESLAMTRGIAERMNRGREEIGPRVDQGRSRASGSTPGVGTNSIDWRGP